MAIMSTTLPRIPKLQPDLVAATPDDGAWKSATGFRNKYYCFMKVKDPLYYNSLADKHTTKYVEKPSVKKHLHTMGLTSVDGTVYPTREEQFEANRINRLYEERQDMLCKLVMREQSHLRHLRRSARAGELMFTKNGVFETNSCDDCHIYHKVTSYLPNKPLCPSSSLGRRQKKEREAKRLLTRRQRNCVSARTSRLKSTHVHTQTMDRVTTQTAKREPPNRSTYIFRGNIPKMGVDTSEPDFSVNESSSCMSRYTSSDIWSESSTDTLLREMSYSDLDFDSGLELIHRLSLENRELDNKLCEQMLRLEKDTLEEIWQKLTEKYTKDFQDVEILKAAKVTTCEFNDQNKVDNCKVEYSRELKRKTSLEAILNVLDNEQNKVDAAMMKQKAADKLRNERCNMDELVAEQIKLTIKRAFEEELEEQKGVLISTNNKARGKAKMELVGKQDDDQITSYRLISHVVRQVHSSGVLSRQSRHESPQIGSNNFVPMSPTEKDVIQTVQTLQQIKSDMTCMFPQIENILKKRIPGDSSLHTNVPNWKSQVPMAVPQEELCSTHDETESSCTAQASKYDSASTLGILSTIWSTIQKAKGPSSDKGGTSEPGYASTKSNEETNDAFTSNSISEKMSSLNSGEEEFTQTSIPRIPTPPAYSRPAGYTVRGVISCQSSLRQIKENSASDFNNEFVSPLAVHSQGVFPYHSQRTHLGIKNNMEITPADRKQFYEERLIRSRDELIKQDERIRNSMEELVPPKRTLLEFYTAEAEGNPMPAPTPEVTPMVSETCMQLGTTALTEESIGIPRTDAEKPDEKSDKPLMDKYLDNASTYTSSAKSLTLSIINASIAKLNTKAQSTSQPEMPSADTKMEPETVALLHTEEANVPKIGSASSTIILSSKKGSKASLNETLGTEKVSSMQKTASSAPTKKSSCSSAASLKETVTASVPKTAIVASTKSSTKASLNETVTTEKVSVPSASIVQKKKSTASIAPPSEVSVESYMEPLSSKNKKTLKEAPVTIKSPTESMKSLRPLRLSLSLKSLLDLLPSKLFSSQFAKTSRSGSRSNNDVTKYLLLGSTSSIHSS